MNFGGFGAGLGQAILPTEDAALQIQQRRQAIAEYLQLQRGQQLLAMQGLGGDQNQPPPASMQPQQQQQQPPMMGGPPQQQPPMPPPGGLPPSLPTGPGGASMPGPPPGASGPPAPGVGLQPPPPPGAAPQMPQGQPGLPQQPQGGGLLDKLNGVRKRVLAANPNEDPGVVWAAMKAAADLLEKDDSMQSRQLIARLSVEGQLLRTKELIEGRASEGDKNRDARLHALEVNDATRRAGQNITLNLGERRIGATERGQDLQHQDRQENLHQKAIKAAQADQPPDPDMLAFEAQSLRAGNLQAVNEVLGYSRNRAKLMGDIIKTARQQDPNFDGEAAAGALAKFGGMRTAANVVGRTGGSTEVGVEEIKELAPMLKDVSSRLNFTEYPTINAIELAIEKGTGSEDAVTLSSYVQTLRNAYVQVMARGGRMSDTQRDYAAKLVNGTMPTNQLSAAAAAILTEGGIVQRATGRAMSNITGRPNTQAAPAGGNNDPLGIR
jgi:hypothetical protein